MQLKLFGDVVTAWFNFATINSGLLWVMVGFLASLPTPPPPVLLLLCYLPEQVYEINDVIETFLVGQISFQSRFG